MNILVANDDGINANGIKALVRALHNEAKADVYVFAPDGQRSAAGHAITLRREIEMWPVNFENAKAAFALDGTPADCVAIGLSAMKEMGVEAHMVFAGINHGSNVGTDTVYSGTIACALEGSIHGIPSVAVSVDSTDPEHFEYVCRLAVDVIEKTGGRWDSDVMLNINSPDMPEDEIRGVCYTILGEREYTNDIQKTGRKGKVVSYAYGGVAVRYDSDAIEKDVIAIQQGYASISPMHKDMTAHEGSEMLEKWRIGK